LKPIVILYSKWNIFSDSNPRLIIDGLSQNSSRILFSTLLNENFQIIHQNKKFDTHLSLSENDIDYIPASYNTITTKIHVNSNPDSMDSILRQIESSAENEYKKVLILFSNVYNIYDKKIESIFNALPSESEKIIIGTDRRDNVCYIGMSMPKKSNLNELKLENVSGEYLLKHFSNEEIEILLQADSDICFDLTDVKTIYNKYKSTQQKFLGSYTHNLINHLTENYKNILQS